MPAVTGIQPLNNYSTGATDAAKVQMLLDLIPDSDTKSSSGAQAGRGTNGDRGFLDEMSPPAATQLRVELTALKAAVS